MIYHKAELFLKKESRLAEGPFWHTTEKKLYWVDIEKKEVHSCLLHNREEQVWNLDKRVGCIVPAKDNKLVCALQGEIIELDTNTGKTRKLLDLENELSDNRSNDGKADPEGRLWIGSMSVKAEKQKASLYRIGRELKAEKILDGLDLSNGLDWSPDKNFFYHIDTPEKKLFAYHFNAREGSLSERRQIDVFANMDGFPDGMCCDEEGKLWVALWAAKKVIRIDPVSGEQLAEITVPAINVSCCCFGSEDMGTLYITTARQGLSEEDLKAYPLSGSIFECRPGVKGKPVNFFNY
jgi:sugar lactone lactonase YvrE